MRSILIKNNKTKGPNKNYTTIKQNEKPQKNKKNKDQAKNTTKQKLQTKNNTTIKQNKKPKQNNNKTKRFKKKRKNQNKKTI